MSGAPLRDVVRVVDLDGPRGGRVFVVVLSCGCWSWSRKPPAAARLAPARARCMGCFVRAQLEAHG